MSEESKDEVKYSDFIKATEKDKLSTIEQFRIGIFVNGEWIFKTSSTLDQFIKDIEYFLDQIIFDRKGE